MTTLDAHAIAQSARTREGRGFEDIVARILNDFVADHDIVVLRGNRRELLEEIDDIKTVDELTKFTTLPVKRRCDQSQIEDYPDSDLFAIIVPRYPQKKFRLLAIINCKVSFHARHTEVCFWGLAVRSSSYIKYVCATEDRDIYRPTNPRSELGKSCKNATAARRLLESYTDRIYIMTKYAGTDDEKLSVDIDRKLRNYRCGKSDIIFDDSARANHTDYCHLVRPFDDLIEDLIRWKQDIPL
jgi:hypothetical protein